MDGILWQNAGQVHHAFRLTDQKSGRVLDGTVEIHTVELGRYNLGKEDLKTASLLECWLYWFLHAHEYETEELLRLLPQEAIQQATQTIARIAQITEDKAMYDAREKAIRDRQTALNSARREGEIKGEIKMIRMLQGLLCTPVSEEESLRVMSLEQLESLTSSLQEQLRGRSTS